MQDRSVRYLLTGQILLFFFLFICILLMPHYLFEANEGGISNFGLHAKTIIPFSLSTISGAGFAFLASFYIPKSVKSRQSLKLMLRIWAALAMVSLISTYSYKLNHVYHSIHVYLSIILLVFELSFSSWLTLILVRDRLSITLWTLQIIGFIFGVLNYFGVVHVLFIVEVWEGLIYAVILIRSLKKLVETKQMN